MKVDLVVIGSGLSGSMAALRAHAQSKKVVVIRKAWGATALSSGAFSATDDVQVSQLDAPFQLLKESLPFKLSGRFKERRPLFLSYTGQFKTADVTFETQHCDIESLKKPALALGIESMIILPKIESDKVVVDHIPWHEREFNLMPAVIAKRLDGLDDIRAFAKQIKIKTASHVFSSLLLPPVVGLVQFEVARRELEHQLGTPVYEMLGPLVSGVRFQMGLDKALKEKGITIVQSKVSEIEVNENKVLSVEGIGADRFVLATGKFFSGGIRKEKRFRETVFNLPLFVDDTPVRGQDTPRFLRRKFLEDQALYRMGVKVNERLNPVGEDGKPVYDNLHACGTIVSGVDAHSEDERFTQSLLTGYQVGDLAS